MTAWFYISFADAALSKGMQFLGGCYVSVGESDPGREARLMLSAAERRGDGTTLDDEQLQIALAIARSHELGINPGGEAQVAGPIPEHMLNEHVPLEDRERLLTREEIER